MCPVTSGADLRLGHTSPLIRVGFSTGLHGFDYMVKDAGLSRRPSQDREPGPGD